MTQNDNGGSTSGIEAALLSIAAALIANPLQQQAWQPVTFINGWTNYGSGFMSVAYYKDNLGMVHMRGMAKSGAGNICVLPAGYRPAGVGYYAAVSATHPGIISIDNNGIVKMDGGSNGYISFDAIHFRAEA